MHYYGNRNEYDILNASSNDSNMSNTYPRYPLANPQQDLMQNTNYKDWLNVCEGYHIENPREASVRAGLGKGLGIVSTIVGFFGGSIILDTIGLFYQISELLWPEDDTQQYTWQDIMNHVEDLIDKRITEVIRGNAIRTLADLQGKVDDYNNWLKKWKDDPKSTGNLSTLVTKFTALDSDFNGAIRTVNNQGSPGYELLLLPVYAQIANLHLLLLRDAQIYGDKWWSARANARDNYYQIQLEKTKEYTEYCINWYNKGLNDFRTAGQWVNFNRYRREMTLTVLDIISMFPIYDARLYPTEVKTELTREIYSDVINGEIYGLMTPYFSFEKAESLYTRAPHLFTWLKGFRFVTNSISYWTFLSGGQNKYSYTNNSSINEGSFRGQDTDYGGTSSTINIPSNSYVYNLWTENYEYIYPWGDPVNITKMNFSVTDNNSSKELIYGAHRTNKPVVRTDFDFLTNKEGTELAKYNDYNHILSYMLINGETFGQKRHGYSFAFTHSSVDPNNTIAANKITQIPVVKASSINGSISIEKGPGFTGGDLVKMRADSGLTMRFKAELLDKKYRVRIRYKCNYSSKLILRKWKGEGYIQQ
ncbi:insecticidal delta-endotoxin Cry8Ea1 family protein, partial [Bacillus thuringiensis]